MFCSSRVNHSLALSVFMPIMHEGPCISFFGGTCTQFLQVNQIMAYVENALELRVNLPLLSLHGPYSLPCHSGKINRWGQHLFPRLSQRLLCYSWQTSFGEHAACYYGALKEVTRQAVSHFVRFENVFCFVLFPLVHTPVLLSTWTTCHLAINKYSRKLPETQVCRWSHTPLFYLRNFCNL